MLQRGAVCHAPAVPVKGGVFPEFVFEMRARMLTVQPACPIIQQRTEIAYLSGGPGSADAIHMSDHHQAQLILPTRFGWLRSRARRFMGCWCFCCLTAALSAPVVAQTVPGDSSARVAPLNALATHRHDPIIVRSKPVIERLPVKVIQPVDLQVTSDGRILVADVQARCVFRLDSDGQVSLAVRDLADIRRIQADRDGSLYVLTGTGGESSLYQSTPDGQTVHLHTLHFPVICFTRNSVGEFLAGHQRQLWKVGNDGQQTMVARLPAPLVDLCLNAAEAPVALLQDGLVYQVNADFSLKCVGRAQPGSQRLLLGAGGRFVTLANSVSGGLPLSASGRGLYHVADVPEDGRIAAADVSSLLALVPEGTEAAGLDPLGNLCLANPDLRAVTKATSRFKIACPHCGQQTLMIFDPAADVTASESF